MAQYAFRLIARELCGLRIAPALLWLACVCAVAEAGPEGRVRVVSQTVGTDELLLALAEPGQVAALSHLAADPAFSAVSAGARAFPLLEPDGDAESILRFGPTLVLFADYSRSELVAQVRRAGVEVMVLDRYRTLDEVYAALRMLAAKLGAEERAEVLIAQCRARVADLEERLRGLPRVRVIAPSGYGKIPGADTTFQDLCDHAGAENLGATLGGLTGHAPPPSEQMLLWPVDRIVLGGTDAAVALAEIRPIPPYSFMEAVKEGRMVLLPPHLMACVSHHRIDGYELLARGLHPEAFP